MPDAPVTVIHDAAATPAAAGADLSQDVGRLEGVAEGTGQKLEDAWNEITEHRATLKLHSDGLKEMQMELTAIPERAGAMVSSALEPLAQRMSALEETVKSAASAAESSVRETQPPPETPNVAEKKNTGILARLRRLL